MSSPARQIEAAALPSPAVDPLSGWIWGWLALASVGWSAFCQRAAFHTGSFRPQWTWLALLAALPTAAIAVRWPRLAPGRRSFLLGIGTFCALAALAPRRATYRPEGDEPFYLAQADLLWRHHDLVASPEEIRQNSAWYFGTSIDPDQSKLVGGTWSILHWPALSLLYLPSAALRSRWLAQILVALIVAAGAASGARAFSRLWGDDVLGCASSALLVATSPLGQFGLALYPDGPVTGLWLIALDVLLAAQGPVGGAAAGFICGLLVWVKPSFGIVAMACAGAAWLAPNRSRSQRIASTVGFCAALGVATGLFWSFQHVVYGSIALGSAVPLDPLLIPTQLGLSIVEPGRGLGVHYPLWAAAIVASIAVVVVHPTRLSLKIGAFVVGPAIIAMAVPAMIANCGALGGWAPPGRYWTSSLPPLVAALALAPTATRERMRALAQRPWARRSAGVMAAFGLFTNLLHTMWPALAFSAGNHWVTKLR